MGILDLCQHPVSCTPLEENSNSAIFFKDSMDRCFSVYVVSLGNDYQKEVLKGWNFQDSCVNRTKVSQSGVQGFIFVNACGKIKY